jgi:hypothetical protein
MRLHSVTGRREAGGLAPGAGWSGNGQQRSHEQDRQALHGHFSIPSAAPAIG